jgi:hypothetical protein
MSPFDNALEDVLKRSKYNVLTGRFVDLRQLAQDAVAKGIRWVLERLRIPDAQALASDPTVIANVILSIFFLALGFFIGAVAWYALRAIRNASNSLGGVFTGIDAGSSPIDLIAKSGGLWSMGKRREAVRHAFAAILKSLDLSGAISIGLAKTNSQLLAELKVKAPQHLHAFKQMSQIFQQVWFGDKEIDQLAFAAYWTMGESLVREVGALEEEH